MHSNTANLTHTHTSKRRMCSACLPGQPPNCSMRFKIEQTPLGNNALSVCLCDIGLPSTPQFHITYTTAQKCALFVPPSFGS